MRRRRKRRKREEDDDDVNDTDDDDDRCQNDKEISQLMVRSWAQWIFDNELSLL